MFYAYASNSAGGTSPASAPYAFTGPAMYAPLCSLISSLIKLRPMTGTPPHKYLLIPCRNPGAPTIIDASNIGSTMDVTVAPPASNGGAGRSRPVAHSVLFVTRDASPPNGLLFVLCSHYKLLCRWCAGQPVGREHHTERSRNFQWKHGTPCS